MATYGVGANLASYGAMQQKEALNEYGVAANEDAKRQAENTQLESQRKQGNQQLGAEAGALAGAYFGPWGMVVGGLIGALGGRLF